MVNYLKEHCFQYKQEYSASTIFAIATSFLSLIASGCSQQTAINAAANSDSSSSKTLTTKTTQKKNVIRLGYQKGGIIPIARQRGELERQLATQNIKVEWSGPFDRCATLLSSLNGNRVDIGGCGDIPAEKEGARVLESAKDILSGNFVIIASPNAIADPQKKIAIADFLCRLQKSQTWRESNLKQWSKNYATTIDVNEGIVYQDAKQGQQQRRQELLPVSDAAIASGQKVLIPFFKRV